MDDDVTLSTLPPDIITDILIRVPVKPLLRFRCVSKRFCTLIDSSPFVKKHLIKHSTNKINTYRTLIVSKDDDPRLYSLDLSLFDHNNNNINNKKKKRKQVVVELNTPIINLAKRPIILVLGSCNGLLCLSDIPCLTFWQDQILLWNPTTRKHKKLPPLGRIPPMMIPFSQTKRVYGFGCFSGTNDYKTVRITHCYDHEGRVLVTEVDVYSLRSNSWRRIDGFPVGNLSLRSQCAELVDECLHWPATMEPLPVLENYELVVGFEIGSESFRMIPLPDVSGGDVIIKSLDGSLCAFYHFDNVGLDLWVMKEYGVKDSWTKLFRVDPRVWMVSNYCTWVPVTYSNNGDKVLFQQYTGTNQYVKQDVISYDLVKKTAQKVDVRGMPDYFALMACSESLVNPGGGGSP